MRALLLPIVAVGLILAACSGGHDGQSRQGQGEHGDRQSQQSEHGQQGQHSQQGEQGEESATQYAKSDTYDQTRNGARLIINYDAEANEFVGTVENTTDQVLTRVRVEVHLSNGTELGPTTPTDLEPSDTLDITLPASEEPFDTWNAHPEVGQEEANHQSDRE